MRLKTLWLPIILLTLAACGGGDDVKLEKGPFLKLDRESLSFNTEIGSGTYLGTSTFNTLYIENGGDEPLVITDFTPAAPDEFIFQLPQELANGQDLKLESRKTTFIQVQFRPTQAKVYQGKFTLKSNAKNAPVKEISMAAEGRTPPAP